MSEETNSVYQTFQGNSYLFAGSAPYVEQMYESYLANPGSVQDSWREYFDALQHVPAADGSDAHDVPRLPVDSAFAERAKRGWVQVLEATSADPELGRQGTAVQQLIAAYRNVGVRWADLDPLKRAERPEIQELELSFYGLTDADLETVFNTSNTFFGKERMPLRELLNALHETYCGTIGAEFMYATDQSRKRWWQEKLESARSNPQLTAAQKKNVLERLTAAEALEGFTTGSAWASRSEGEAGRLAAGMRADFVVLAEDPLQVPGETLDELTVMSTWVDGEAVYLAD